MIRINNSQLAIGSKNCIQNIDVNNRVIDYQANNKLLI